MSYYIAIAKVTYYDEFEEKEKTETIMLSEVSCFANAAERIEEAYKESLCSFQITLLDDGPFIYVENIEENLKSI